MKVMTSVLSLLLLGCGGRPAEPEHAEQAPVKAITTPIPRASAVVSDTGAGFPYPAAADITIRGFAQEVLYGTGTGRTARFDDYKPGSYHLQPKELLERLPQEARTHKLRLKAAVVIGPFGPIWTYEVVALLKEASCTRVNRLVMPHARITFKATGCLPDAEAAKWLSRLRKEIASAAGLGSADRDSCAVVAEYTGSAPDLAHSPFGCAGKDSSRPAELLDAMREELGARLVPTYHAYPPVPDQR